MPPIRPCPICKRPPSIVECVDHAGWHVLCAQLLPAEHWIAVYGLTQQDAVAAWHEAFPNGLSRFHKR